jgi:hypothetical protein
MKTRIKEGEKGPDPTRVGCFKSGASVVLGLALGVLAGIVAGLVVGVGLAMILGVL